jgi:hypothetical protein
MSATNGTETAILSLIFTATTWADIAENDTTGPATSFWISLHTASPGEAGDQTSNETAYTGYARQQVTRDGTGWTVTGGSVTNDGEIAFPQCTASPGSALTHVGIGKSETSTGTLLLYAALDSSVTMQVGTVPIFSAGELEITCD